MIQRIIDLTHHDVVLATGLQARHGISGHTYELLEYWYYLKVLHCIDVAVLCTAHKPEVMLNIAHNRYTFTDVELSMLKSCLYDGTNILLARLPITIWVDGCTHYDPSAAALAKRNIAFACNNAEDLDKMDLVLGDTRIYDIPCDHYVKKLLFSKFKPVTATLPDKVAMLYCTYQARKLKPEYIRTLPERFPEFDRFVLITNDDIQPAGKITVQQPPVNNIFELFTTYIYSPLKISWPGEMGVGDCSPRFPAECTYFNKTIIIDAPVNRGLAVRLRDCRSLDNITLTKEDPLVNYL